MWSQCRFEEHLIAALRTEFGEPGANKYITAYNRAKGYLCDNIYREISLEEPDLTRHDETHVVAVMDRIADLILREKATSHDLSALDLYTLAMATLFHDVGNIDGRQSHSSASCLFDIFTSARGDSAEVRRERTVVLAAVRAHGGVASDGTGDTLKELKERDTLYTRIISLRDIGAILRFADELAEGPERTSEFCRKDGRYAESSQLYHDYASVTHVAVDQPNGRVMLNYEIEVSEGCPSDCVADNERCPCSDRWNAWCGSLVEFIYDRISKLDQERRYARYYTSELSAFVATEASMNFHWHGLPVLMGEVTPNPMRLDEKVVPGTTPAETIPVAFPAYEKSMLIGAINEGIQRLEMI